MAVEEKLIANASQMRMNLGTDAQGEIKLKSESLGKLSTEPSDWDAEKALNVALALDTCLHYRVYDLLHTATYDIEETSSVQTANRSQVSNLRR